MFSLRPTAAQNRKKGKHQKAIYDQLSTKLRYSIVRFFSFIFPAYTTSGFDMSGTMDLKKYEVASVSIIIYYSIIISPKTHFNLQIEV